MYLRNKKTGEVVDWSFVGPTAIKEYEGEDVLLERERYESIEEFISEWEDYNPAEPLIKDEKIRKAVRAVADITGVSMLYYEYSNVNEMVQLFDNNGHVLAFKSDELPVEELNSYTIAELCGEDEE